MNLLDNEPFDNTSFAYGDLYGQDQWINFTPIFGSITLVGAPTYLGRGRVVGKSFQFQVKLSAVTSIATVAGTDYFTLPKVAKGFSGMALMTNDTTNIAVGLCHLDVTTSRCYLPTQTASGNIFLLAGWYEI